MSVSYNWDPFFQAVNNVIAQQGDRNRYQAMLRSLIGSGTPTPPTVGAPGVAPGMTQLDATAPQLPGGPAPAARPPVNLSLPGGGATAPAPGGISYNGPAGQMLGSGAAGLLPLLKNADPSVGMPLLLNLAAKNAERQQSIQDAALTPMTSDEKKAMGFKPDAVVYKDISGNPVVKQGSDMLSQGAIDQQLGIKRQEGQIAADAPLTKYQKAEIGISQAQLHKPTEVGFGGTLVDPVTGKVIYSGGNQAASVPTGADGQPLTGDAYLKTLPPNLQSTVKAIATYRQAPLTGMAMRSPYGAQLASAVNQYNPQYDATQYGSKTKARNDFATGKNGNTVRSLNVAVQHLDQLGQLSQALGNGDIQAVNRIGQFIGQQTGRPAPTNFNAAKQLVGDEIVKAIVGAGGGVGDREEAARNISAASSPQQLAGVIQTYKGLMAGQLSGLHQQYQKSTGLNDFEDYLAPETRAQLEMHGAGGVTETKTIGGKTYHKVNGQWMEE
jgi:hypothetical protein